MTSRTLYLHLRTNPHGVFYKDEGGKSNYLSASCYVAFSSEPQSFKSQSSLVSFAAKSRPTPIGNLVITPRLTYENGVEIEDEKDIFNVLDFDPKTITATNEVFTVNFRIEKVSRRKDGKKFRVRFDYNDQKSNLLHDICSSELESVQSTPVTVLSKRKSIAPEEKRQKAARRKEREVKEDYHMKSTDSEEDDAFSVNGRLRNMSIQKEKQPQKPYQQTFQPDIGTKQMKQETVELPLDLLLKIKENMLRLEERVVALSDRVAYLETTKEVPSTGTNTSATSNTSTGSINRGQRVHSLMFENAFEPGGNSPRESSQQNGHSNGVSSTPPPGSSFTQTSAIPIPFQGSATNISGMLNNSLSLASSFGDRVASMRRNNSSGIFLFDHL